MRHWRPITAWASAQSYQTSWVLGYPRSHSKDYDQTGRIPRLIWVFAGCTGHLLVLSRGGSYHLHLLDWVCLLQLLCTSIFQICYFYIGSDNFYCYLSMTLLWTYNRCRSFGEVKHLMISTHSILFANHVKHNYTWDAPTKGRNHH